MARTIVTLLLVLGACGSDATLASAQGAASSFGPSQSGRLVVLVSIDGLAPWVMKDTPTPTLDRLGREGAIAARAETVIPSKTMPSHASMLSGVGPDRHGVTWNTWKPTTRLRRTTVFTVCKVRKLRCGLFVGKPKMAWFGGPKSGSTRTRVGGSFEQVLSEARRYAASSRPDFMFVHLAEVDHRGHAHGWGSSEQRAVIEAIDKRLASFVEGVQRESDRPVTFILTSDHGGHGSGHGDGGRVETDILILWVAWGDSVEPGIVLPMVSTLDTGATILRLLGTEPPADWVGRPLFESSKPAIDTLDRWPD